MVLFEVAAEAVELLYISCWSRVSGRPVCW